MWLWVTVLIVVGLFCAGANLPNPDDPTDYGVDVTYPIHYHIKEPTHFKKRYDGFIQGCYNKYDKKECDRSERDRLEMNRLQPPNEHNYTSIGFKKRKVPEDIFRHIRQFWDDNKHKERIENFGNGYAIVNHWESPTYMVSFEDKKLRGGWDLKAEVWNTMKPILEEWVGRPVYETSLYGIRKYSTGAILSTHVDRLPLVSSAIINVDQDVDEPWPVEVYSHDGKAYNVTMEPGDMVMYESHTVLHGRPFPMKGRYYANIFVHFKPYDHEENNEKDYATRGKGPSVKAEELPEEGEDVDPEEEERRRDELAKRIRPGVHADGQTALHLAASRGDLSAVQKLLETYNEEFLHTKDANEWQAIHEAAKGGHTEILKYLIDHGADIGAKTSNGGTVLWWAKHMLDEGHEVIEYLESIGAPDEGGEL